MKINSKFQTATAPQPLGPTGVAPGTTEIKPLSQTTQGHIPIPKPKPAVSEGEELEKFEILYFFLLKKCKN